ncbi:hypothetical protein [Urbifossiella limnaea]|uniref:Uncharacterized protein n=1 Tax=Urbifossiella limnaea TaxID=2528023 RepID=A0A517XQG2_9BACT|nr:hypothetical protein [Urbifossiella limnaea]QDU19747.1 hypothetical protein ETAA1_16830 [Urbifossiella limnaea]
MTTLVRRQLADLAAFVANLKERVRVAVAGELSRAVGDAVREVVGAVVARRVLAPPRSAPRGPWADRDERADGWGRPRDPWADDRDDDYDPDRGEVDDRAAGPPPGALVTVAVAAGAAVARWWAGRAGGGVLAAAGVGLGVGLVGLLGGSLARTAVAVLAAAADVLAATDALGAGAARLGRL